MAAVFCNPPLSIKKTYAGPKSLSTSKWRNLSSQNEALGFAGKSARGLGALQDASRHSMATVNALASCTAVALYRFSYECSKHWF
jgi:hypothetical protein